MSGDKAELIASIKRRDLQFVVQICKELEPSNEFFVEERIGPVLVASMVDLDFSVVTIAGQSVTKGMLRQFLPHRAIESNVMALSMQLFQDRDETICETHALVNDSRANYVKLRRSKFLPYSCYLKLSSGAATLDAIKAEYFADWSEVDYCYIFFLVEAPGEELQDKWALLFVDMSISQIQYLNPRKNGEDPFTRATRQVCQEFQDVLQPFLVQLMPDNQVEWKTSLTPTAFNPACTNEYDTGMYVIVIIYFIVYKAPIHFEPDIIPMLRKKWAYWLLSTKLCF